MTQPRVLLYAPQLYELGFKQHHIDGEALALHAHLRSQGYDSVLADAYYRAAPAPPLAQAAQDAGADAVIVHLWTSDAYGPRLRDIAGEMAAVRRDTGLPVIGFGPLAVSAAAELAAHGAIDHTAGLPPHGGTGNGPAGLMGAIGQHLLGHTPLTALSRDDLPYLAGAVISVSASRGCRGKCTFCAYNSDLGGGWIPLDITAVAADIAHLHELTGATRFALADSDFGGTPAACRMRARQLADALQRRGLARELTLSINVRSETLDPDTIMMLASAGVRTMLIGAESFNPATLHRVYGKRQDITHLREVVRAADQAGITTVASYILWHPWQTLDSIRQEAAAIEEFGRWRIPQFMARSRLLVIPGTVIERNLRDAGLLDAGPFQRRFRFADPAAAALHSDLAGWFAQHAQPVLTDLSEHRTQDMTTLGGLKHAEWQWLTARAGLAGARSA